MELSRSWHNAPLVQSLKSFGLSTKGKGLNSIPIRFSLMVAVFSACGIYVHHYFLYSGEHVSLSSGMIGAMALMIVVPAAITYYMAGKLTKAVRALHHSTDLLASGDFDSPVDVQCNCEVGGLADSFRMMANRFNANILRMNALAYTDQVTGLPNRVAMNHALHVFAKQKADTPGCKGTLFFIDLDDFKRVNDALGHEAGDELLRQVTGRVIEDGLDMRREELDDCMVAYGGLSEKCPKSIVLSRLGGDEFAMFLPDELDQGQLEQRAARILQALARPFEIHGFEQRIGASIGIARLGIDTRDPELLLKYADIAMNTAKQAGKNRCQFFDAGLEKELTERRQMEDDLRKAIERGGEIFLHFQPKVNAATLELSGVEALARWRHPVKGMIPPDQFIRVAEQSGMMLELGSYIMHMAMRQAVAWKQEGKPTHILVNVSPVQFREPDFAASIFKLFDWYELDASLMGIEITETMVISDLEASREKMEQLRNAGVVIAIDDFGTGYSNLSQFAYLPYSLLKLDKSLIDAIGVSQKSEAILIAIIQVAHALGLKLVAEGVETVEQQRFLAARGCDELQGYLLARPMPAEDLAQWESQRAADSAATRRVAAPMLW
jgi:two-component system CheB/CheR fusion protein